MDITKDIGDLIKAGSSLEEIAVKFGVTAPTVYRWWKGVNKPNEFTQKKIARMADSLKGLK